MKSEKMNTARGIAPLQRGSRRRLSLALAAAVSALALTACAVAPQPLTDTDMGAVVQADLAQIFSAQEPVTGAISLHEAMARAIKHNLDHRLKLMEEALGADQLTSANLDMLPRLTANAGYSGRNSYLATRSQDVGGLPPTGPFSYSQERETLDASLALTWNVLDFGVSYVRAKQAADRALILEERRRKVVHNIIQDVRDAYWSAYSADLLIARIDPMLERVESALERTREIEQRRLQPPLEVLSYRRDLLEVLRQLTLLRRDLASAKSRLAALMSLPMGSEIRLSGLGEESVVPDLSLDVAALEDMALLRRPEMREEVYQHRISTNEVRRAFLQMLPGISLSGGFNYTSNTYTDNQTWWNWGSTLTGNLFDLIAGPQRVQTAETQVDVVETRRLALAMAVMSQVHISWRDYRESLAVYHTTAELAELENALLTQTRNAARMQGDLAEIQAELRAMLADLRRDLAFAGVRTAFGRVLLSVGVDPLPDAVDSHDLATLTEALRTRSHQWLNGQFSEVPTAGVSSGEAVPSGQGAVLVPLNAMEDRELPLTWDAVVSLAQ